MKRSNRTLLVFLLSVLIAGVASMFVYRAVQAIPVREVEVKSYQVAVAARPLPVGTMLTASDVRLVAWPASSPVAGGYSTVEDVVNRGLVAPVVENEPLTAAKVAVAEAGAGLPPTITAGMRAISVKVNEVIGVAGFVVPGTRVDVVVTLAKREESVSRVVVTNVQVLTAGTRYDQDQAKDGKPVPSTVVTLLVTPEDAERIALASAEGQIMLTLRNPLDTEATETKGTRLASLMGAPDPPPVTKVVQGVRRAVPPPAPQAPPPPPVYAVETIRAAKRTSEVVK
ncbi:MAG: Flp pilus assembly protein CpaB [Acidobacteria bacterium]|nr:Flp pilus assembly protein CpaB [Acidobacteriota bacterium]